MKIIKSVVVLSKWRIPTCSQGESSRYLLCSNQYFYWESKGSGSISSNTQSFLQSYNLKRRYFDWPAWMQTLLLGDAGGEASVSFCCFCFASAWLSGLGLCVYLIRGNCGVWSHCFSALLLVTTLIRYTFPEAGWVCVLLIGLLTGKESVALSCWCCGWWHSHWEGFILVHFRPQHICATVQGVAVFVQPYALPEQVLVSSFALCFWFSRTFTFCSKINNSCSLPQERIFF